MGLVVGSIIVGKVDKNRLVACPFSKSVGSRFGKPLCLCSLGGGVCRYCGKRVRFSYHFDGFHVVWVCEKLIGLPDLER